MTKIIKHIQVIIPLRKKCHCGKTVKNHHFLCDECWARKERRKREKVFRTQNKRNKHKPLIKSSTGGQNAKNTL